MIAVGLIGKTKLICFENGFVLRFNKKIKKWVILNSFLCNEYIRVSLDCKKYYLHRVLAHAFGILDLHNPLKIDHIDRNKTNNFISNYRPVTVSQNAFNQNAKGYRFHKLGKKWESTITVSGKYVYIGWFDTEEEASQAYQDAKLKYHVF